MTELDSDFDIISNRRNIAVSKGSIENLKTFSKNNKLKMYETVNALSRIILEDDDLGKRVVEAVERARGSGEKQTSTKLISQLPSDARKKLKSLTPEQLTALLETM